MYEVNPLDRCMDRAWMHIEVAIENADNPRVWEWRWKVAMTWLNQASHLIMEHGA